jgi:hypothetical protein
MVQSDLVLIRTNFESEHAYFINTDAPQMVVCIYLKPDASEMVNISGQ